ncbi:MAG: hypothetical protein WDN29_00120 [Methylovirgula sp.]
MSAKVRALRNRVRLAAANASFFDRMPRSMLIVRSWLIPGTCRPAPPPAEIDRALGMFVVVVA